MPHIFFERLEQRKNTQSLLGFGSEFLGNLNLFGSSSYSSYYPSASSFGSYGSYSQYGTASYFPMPPIPMCYYPPWPILNDYVTVPVFDNRALPFNDIGPFPAVNSLFNSFSQPSWSAPNSVTTPYSSGSLFNSGFGSNPLRSPFSGGNFQAPALGQDILPSLIFDSNPLPAKEINQDRLSKLGKMRENLIAFFRSKGILSDKQRQRLLS